MLLAEKKRKRWIGMGLVLSLCLFCLSTPFQQFASFPNELRIFSGAVKQLHLSMPVTAHVSSSNPNLLKINGNSQSELKVDLRKPISVSSRTVGETELELKVFGLFPLKKVKVDVYPEIKVIPGGQSIGVKLKSAGILVVGHYLINQGDKKVSPGESAHLKVGDVIVKVNGNKAEDVHQISKWVQKAGESDQSLNLTVLRDNETFTVNLNPILDTKDKSYRIGLYIRDSAAGVGTLTFYAPNEKIYGALGHVITDMDTQKPIIVGGGQIVPSKVTSIEKGHNGSPGEKIASMLSGNSSIGTIEKNTPFGIFGKMNKLPENSISSEPIPIAFTEEVKVGPAEILTVVDGQKVERFDIEVSNVIKQKYPASKGLIIKITDPELLNKTGGIVQGMSGSPIIQNGKIIGAVSHVFVNDPTSGYGVFIEWMIRDAGINLQKYQASSLKAS
jgi:stage IV sporulation protein B